MKKLFLTIYTLFSFLLLTYLSLPTPPFPEPPPGSLQSNEPGDSEDLGLRRAYFTNATREEVREHYKNYLSQKNFLDFTLPTYKLNYPPEEAQVIIRDQTRSSYLEEIVHPLRESIYVNGFIPESEKDTILIENKVWQQKLTVKYVVSPLWARILVGTGVVVAFYFVAISWAKFVSHLKNNKQ